MTTPQTEKLQPSPPARYNEISRHLLQQAEEELEKGDSLQASEKVWLAVAPCPQSHCPTSRLEPPLP